ncbi:MAG: flippase-like domain-containing protein [Gemmatimonadaceae bacterium]|nr:flippase-like domain-containing protein [Gemmatimonadaceae bacterium]
MLRRTLHTIVRMALILVTAYALWRWVDWAMVGAALSQMSPAALALAVGLAWADRVLMGYKWRQLVRAAGGSLRLRDATNIYYQTCFTDLVLPNVVASEGLRVYLGRRLGIPFALLLGSMAIERMVAAAVAISLAGAGLLYLAATIEPRMRQTFLEIIAATAVLAALGVLAVWWTPLHRTAGRALRERISPKIFQLLKKISASLVEYRGQPAALAINLPLAFAENLLQIVNFFVIGRALGIRVAILPFFAAIAVTALVRRLAMHVEGRGLGEGAAVVMFALLGVQKDAAVALTFAHYALWLLASLPGAYLLFRSGVKFRDVKNTAMA